MFLMVLLAVLCFAAPAQAMPSNMINWALADSSLRNLRTADAWMAAHHLNSSLAHISGNEFKTQNAVPAGWASTAAVKFESYATFVEYTDGDVSNGELEPAIGVVIYDPEQWAETPVVEQQDPPTYMRLFCARAYSVGRECWNAPARTLMQVAGSVFHTSAYGNCGSSGKLTQRYLACDLAGHAARFADGIDIQMQVHQQVAADYDAYVNAARADALAANNLALTRSNLSTSIAGTTVTHLCDARRVIKADLGAVEGHWLHASSTTGKIGTDFLGLLHNGRC